VWAALQDVRDENVIAGESHGRDDLGQELPGTADEWFTLSIFICARGFADEHEFRVDIANSEYRLRA
jgi:hypothetical protein